MIFIINSICYSAFAIPNEGEYKIFSSFICCNLQAENIQSKISNLYESYCRELSFIEELRIKLLNDVELEEEIKIGRENVNNVFEAFSFSIPNESVNFKKHLLRKLSNSKTMILEKINALSYYFSDKIFASLILEYGLYKNQSLSLAINYTLGKSLAHYNHARYNKPYTNLDIIYKYKMFDFTKSALYIQPNFSILTRQKEFAVAIDLIGTYETRFKKFKKNVFTELGISFGRFINKKNVLFSTNCSQSIQFASFTVSNYVKYSLMNNSSPIYKMTLYEQISVAKKLIFGKYSASELNLQLGYFFDKSLVPSYDFLQISGVVFAIWFNC